MFDIGFWELIVIGVLGLIVLGPERMPQAVRTVSQWISTIRGTASSIKQQVSQELKLEQMRADLKKAEQQGLKDLAPDLKASVDELKSAAEFVQKPFESLTQSTADSSKNTSSDSGGDKPADR